MELERGWCPVCQRTTDIEVDQLRELVWAYTCSKHLHFCHRVTLEPPRGAR